VNPSADMSTDESPARRRWHVVAIPVVMLTLAVVLPVAYFWPARQFKEPMPPPPASLPESSGPPDIIALIQTILPPSEKGQVVKVTEREGGYDVTTHPRAGSTLLPPAAHHFVVCKSKSSERMVVIEVAFTQSEEVHVTLADQSGRPSPTTKIPLGWRGRARPRLVHHRGQEYLELGDEWNRSSYFAFRSEKPVLVHLEGSSEAIRSHYYDDQRRVGSPVPRRTPEEWEKALGSKDQVEALSALVWLGGIHAAPDAAGDKVVHEEARIAKAVHAREGVQRLLAKYKNSEDPWLSEAATFALTPIFRNAKPAVEEETRLRTAVTEAETPTKRGSAVLRLIRFYDDYGLLEEHARDPDLGIRLAILHFLAKASDEAPGTILEDLQKEVSHTPPAFFAGGSGLRTGDPASPHRVMEWDADVKLVKGVLYYGKTQLLTAKEWKELWEVIRPSTATELHGLVARNGSITALILTQARFDSGNAIILWDDQGKRILWKNTVFGLGAVPGGTGVRAKKSFVCVFGEKHVTIYGTGSSGSVFAEVFDAKSGRRVQAIADNNWGVR
jgi:hypothetical protein